MRCVLRNQLEARRAQTQPYRDLLANASHLQYHAIDGCFN